MRKLLKINKGKRLGGTSGGAASVMKHKWFSGFNWKGLLKKELEVPINPEVSKLGEGVVWDVLEHTSKNCWRITCTHFAVLGLGIIYLIGPSDACYHRGAALFF